MPKISKIEDLVSLIKKTAQKPVRLMEVCGTHTVAIAKHGLKELLPPELELLSGPGCPVCVTSQGEIDLALELALRPGLTIFTFGDMLRVPGSQGSLETIKSQGGRIQIAYTPLTAVQYARANPQEEVVFLGIGFETTAPTVAVALEQALQLGLANFSVLSFHKKVIPALQALVSDKDIQVDGFLLPGHASSILGQSPYEFLARDFQKACAITGFEAHHILEGIYLLLVQIKKKEYQIEIQYKKGVKPEGNPVARAYLDKYFEAKDTIWRGLGPIPHSGLVLKEQYEAYDASKKFGLKEILADKPTGCSCGEILRGLKRPIECALFAQECTPSQPVGPCMVSSEGSCAASYHYGR